MDGLAVSPRAARQRSAAESTEAIVLSLSTAEGDDEFEPGQGDDHHQWRHPGNAEQEDEAGEHLHHRVAGRHVREQAQRQADRARKIRQHFDRDDQPGEQLPGPDADPVEAFDPNAQLGFRVLTLRVQRATHGLAQAPA